MGRRVEAEEPAEAADAAEHRRRRGGRRRAGDALDRALAASSTSTPASRYVRALASARLHRQLVELERHVGRVDAVEAGGAARLASAADRVEQAVLREVAERVRADRARGSARCVWFAAMSSSRRPVSTPM